MGDDYISRNKRVEAALQHAKHDRMWSRVPCPFCADAGHIDRKYSLGVRSDSGFYHCMRCGVRGNLRKKLYDYVEADDSQDAWEPPEGYVCLGSEDGKEAEVFRKARKYVKSRGVSPKMARALQIGACDSGDWANRVIIPVLDELGEWHGWVGRLWHKKPPSRLTGVHALKYRYPKGFSRGKWMYNKAALFEVTDTPVLLVEGAFDTFPFWPDAVAAFGDVSNEHIEAMKQAKRPIAIVPDGDAWQDGWILAARLRFLGLRAGYVRLPPKMDPDEVDRDWLLAESAACIDRGL